VITQMIHAADLHLAREKDGRLIENLEEQLAVAPEEFLLRLSLTLRMPAVSLASLREETPEFGLLPYAEATRRCCVATRDDEGDLWLVLGDPYDLDTQEWLEARINLPFRYRVAHRLDVQAYLSEQEEQFRALDGVSSSFEGNLSKDEKTQEISFENAAEGDSPVVRLVTSTLYDALKAGASDVHLESTPKGLTIKYRIDGVLTSAESVPGIEIAEQVISRIKVMSELDIAEKRIPQDGRFKLRLKGRTIDFRVSIMPSVHGEDCVIRILDKESMNKEFKNLRLDILGFDEETMRKLRKFIREPYGMVLVTGPTGSGKTTTLYACLSEIQTSEDKIITIEDPVEYQLKGITQIPVNEKKGLTFARGLRSILRHDPDKVMVGEIRDEETAQIAIQSALTGHLVFTTVHANNVVDVLGRFLNMKVDLYNFVSALNCVLAQRLVRKTCLHCKHPVKLSPQLLEESGLDPAVYSDFTFHEGRGCIECNGTGFLGRVAVSELLDLSDHIRELILDRRPASEIKRAAKEEGMTFLRESALEMVFRGVTTLREINKVTFVD
jgi:general secretion pathway protein E